MDGGRGLLFDKAVHTAADEDAPGDIDWAVVFLNSDILRACVIVDTPGFSASDTDTDRAAEACRGAEILIYCSPVVNCLNAEDLIRLNHMMAALPCPETLAEAFPTLGNFLFVITHAGPQVTIEQIKKAHRKVSDRFSRRFEDNIQKRNPQAIHSPLTEEQVAKRVVTFWGELESRYRDMREKVYDMLHKDFPSYRMGLADTQILQFRETATASNRTKIDKWKIFLNKWEESKIRVQQIEGKEDERKEWVSKQRQSIEVAIGEHKSKSVARYDHYYSKWASPDRVEEIISRFSKREDAENEIAPLLLKELQDYVASDLENRSKLIAEQLNEFLRDYAKAGGTNIDFGIDGQFAPGFDAVASFAGGLAGLATFGALAVWAATLGNLGGYIIIAQIVGLLSAIGIPTGGVAAVVAAISALGGPVVFALALAVLAAIATFFWFSKSWQRRMAEKICDEFTKQGLQERLKKNIKSYWNDTIKAFRQAAAALERDWCAYLTDLKKLAEADSREGIQSRIDALERLNDFFVRLPWLPFRRTLELTKGDNHTSQRSSDYAEMKQNI